MARARHLADEPGRLPHTRLRGHLVDDHQRSALELGDVALLAIHRLEHLDDELGLLALDHVHPHD
jgi:hypothetical protein